VYQSAEAIQCFSGIVPVTEGSGKTKCELSVRR